MTCLRAAVVVVVALAPHHVSAQPVPNAFTLDAAIQYSTEHYPTIRAALEQVTASTAGVDVARTAYLPRLDAMWQSNRATTNNVFGQVLPQSVIPALTGPVLPSASSQSVWGSATGALLSWEPFDFGLRHATVAGADAAVMQARAGETLTRLDVQSAVATAFLGVLAAQRAVQAAQADVERRNVLLRSVQALVNNQLRPGADQSRADAERAAAQTRQIQAQQALLVAQAVLTRMLGVTTAGVTISGDSLLARIPPADIPSAAASLHPLAQLRQATVDQAKRGRSSARTNRSARVSSCSQACSREGAAPIRPACSMGARAASVSIARTGQRACRSCFRTCSIFPASARARRRPRRRPARAPRSTTRRFSRSRVSSRRRRRVAADHALGRREHTDPVRGRAAERDAGARPLRRGARQHRRSRRRAEPARAGRGSGSAGARRRVARAAWRSRRAG